VTEGICSDTASTSLVVVEAPEATASNTGPYCAGETIELVGGVDGMDTYRWDGPGGYVSHEQSPVIPQATEAMSGEYTLLVTYYGRPMQASTVVEVGLQPEASAWDDSQGREPCFAYCAGETIALHGWAPTTVDSYWWTGPNGFTSAEQGPTISSADPSMSGSYCVTVTSGGCSDTACVEITVLDGIEATASSTGPYLAGEQIQLLASPDGMLDYEWFGPNGFRSHEQNPVIPSATAAAAGTYTVEVRSLCCSDTADTVVTVEGDDPPCPAATAYNETSAACPEVIGQGSLRLYGGPDGMDTYSWTGRNGFTSAEQAPTLGPELTPEMAGPYELTVRRAGCPDSTATTWVYLAAPWEATAGNTGPYEVGDTIELQGGPEGMASYVWQGPHGIAGRTKDLTIPAATAEDHGLYTLVVTDGCRESDAITYVQVCPDLGATARNGSVDYPPCNTYVEGQTIELFGGPDGMESYSWTGPNGFESSEQNPQIPDGTPAMSGTYVLTVTEGNCSDTASTELVVTPWPSLSVGNTGPYCAGETIELQASPAGMDGYMWWGPDGFLSTEQNPVIPNAEPAMSGTYHLEVTQDCRSYPVDPATGEVLMTDVLVGMQPVATARNGSVDYPPCNTYVEGQTIELFGGPDGMESYSWTGPNGFESSEQNPQIPDGTPAMSGTYVLTVTEGNCSDTASTELVVTPWPSLSVGNTGPYCAGETIELQASPAGMDGYMWWGPDGFLSTEQNPVIPNAEPAMSGTYHLEVTQDCRSYPVDPATGEVLMTDVLVGMQPVATARNGSVDYPPCNTYVEGQTIELFGGPDGMESYSWTGPNGFESSEQNPQIPDGTPAMSGTYVLTVTEGNCSDTASTELVVTPWPSLSVGNTGPYCAGETIELQASPAGMDGYMWWGPDGFLSTEQNPVIPNAEPAMSGTYHLEVTQDCRSYPVDPATGEVLMTDVLVGMQPVATARNGSVDYPPCNTYVEGQTIELFGGPDGMESYSWTGPNGFESSEQNPQIPDGTPAMSGTYVLTVTEGNCSDTASTELVVTPWPSLSVGNTGPYCAGETIELQASPAGMDGYMWWGPEGFLSTEQNPVIPNATPAMSGVYHLEVTQDCRSYPVDPATGEVLMTEVLVGMQPVATARSETEAYQPGCIIEGISFELYGGPDGMDSYSWTGPDGFASSEQNPTIADATPAMSGTYVLTVTEGLCSDSASVDVTVEPYPELAAWNTGPYCAEEPIELHGGPDGMLYYFWLGPGGFFTAGKDATIPGSRPERSGLYELHMSPGCGIWYRAGTFVEVAAQPVAMAINGGPYRPRETIELFGGPDNMDAYHWTGPAGYESFEQSPAISDATAAMGGEYVLTVQRGACAASAVTVVEITGTALLAYDQSVYTEVSLPVEIELAGDGPAPLTYVITTEPHHGTLTGAPPELVYTPEPGFFGADVFRFKVESGGESSTPAKVSIDVNALPVAYPQSIATDIDTAVAIELVGTDPDKDPLAFAIEQGPLSGTLHGEAPGLTYVPDAGFHGVDGFSFSVHDGRARSEEAWVGIAVTALGAGDPRQTPVPEPASGEVTSGEDRWSGSLEWSCGDADELTEELASPGAPLTLPWSITGDARFRLLGSPEAEAPTAWAFRVEQTEAGERLVPAASCDMAMDEHGAVVWLLAVEEGRAALLPGRYELRFELADCWTRGLRFTLTTPSDLASTGP